MSDLTKSIANDFLKNGKTSSAHDDLQSLTQLAAQPKKLHRTLFKLIEKKKMKKMLPPSLRNMKTSAVKQLCLEKLEQIPQKSIVKMIVGGESPESSQESGDDDAGSNQPVFETECPKDNRESRREIEKSTSRDDSKSYTERSESPGRSKALRSNKSPTSSSWTSGSGERQWSRSPSAGEKLPETPKLGSDHAPNRDETASKQEATTWLDDLDTDELELRARALRSLSNRLDRLQGRVPDQEPPGR